VEFFYEAFRDLQTERPVDGAIPWRAAMAYARHKGLAPDVADLLWTVVRKMDDAEREWQVENMQSESAGA
jgi:hypothetical protein